jgi:electron transfer flavoprotein beta subunit
VLRVAVCVKQIPDPASPGRLDSETHDLAREGKLIMDDSDSYGVEMGLQLAAKAGGGDVTLLSMAPRGETTGLRNALAMGADRAVLVSDDALAGADALVTARVLAAVLERIGPDLIIAGTESSDGYTGTLPVQIAEFLGLPSVSFSKNVEIAGRTLTIERQTESGYDQVEVPLPAVITVTAGAVTPRYPAFKGIMAAKKKAVEQLTVADLGLDRSMVTTRQEVTSVSPVAARGAGEILVDNGDAHEKIVAFLEQIKII